MKSWDLSIGLYPGVLIGMRSYVEKTFIEHVIYLPFVDIALQLPY